MSTGPLVPVLRGRSEAEARAAARLLEAHEIPALLDSELPGVVLPFLPDHARRPGMPSVLVPLTLARSAQRVLARHDERRPPEGVRLLAPELRRRLVLRPAVPPVLPAEAPPPLPVALPPPPPAVELEASEDLPADEDELRFVEPPPSPLPGRLALALGAIALGLGAQHLLERALGGSGAVRALLGVRAPVVDEPWRLVTAAFLHSSPSHVLGNAMFGLLVGVVLFGTHHVGATALTWVLTSVAGLVAEAAFSPGALVIGASAGNYGLVGLWTRGQVERSRFVTFPRRERLRTLGVIALLVPGALTPFSSTGTRVAVMAHAAGFVAGYLAGHFFPRRLDPDVLDGIRRRARRAGWLALMLVLLAVGGAMARTAR